jgi:hypothetical protein
MRRITLSRGGRASLKLAASLAVMATSAAAAPAAPPSLGVSPTSVPAGGPVHAFGSVGTGCLPSGGVTVFSRAFSPLHNFAGVPAIFARVGTNRRFFATTLIPITRAVGVYSVGARCGGGNFGQATLRVNRSPFVAVLPASVRRGTSVRVFGSVRAGCPRGASVTLISRAFTSPRRFAGVPAISATVGLNGAYSVRTLIAANRMPALYSVGARCGGGNVGSTSLRVR